MHLTLGYMWAYNQQIWLLSNSNIVEKAKVINIPQ